MRESLIEKDGVKYAEARGWLVRKQSSPGTSGVHDRIHFKSGVTFTIEYKTTGKKATPKQRAEAIKLQSRAIPCRCCDNVQDAREFIDEMTSVASRRNPFIGIYQESSDISSFNPN